MPIHSFLPPTPYCGAISHSETYDLLSPFRCYFRFEYLVGGNEQTSVDMFVVSQTRSTTHFVKMNGEADHFLRSGTTSTRT